MRDFGVDETCIHNIAAYLTNHRCPLSVLANQGGTQLNKKKRRVRGWNSHPDCNHESKKL